MFLRRLIEKRFTLASPPESILDLLSGGTTIAGIRVSPSTALGLSVYYTAILAISEDTAKLSFPVLRQSGDTKTRDRSHPVDVLLNVQANPFVSAMSFRETWCSHALGWGNGYAEIIRNGFGDATELWNLSPDLVAPEFATNEGRTELVYRVQRAPGLEQVILPARNVLHLHGMGFDGLTGYSIAHIARESLGAALGVRASGAALWGNQSRPDGVIEVEHKLKDHGIELKKAWEDTYKGASKQHQTAILMQGGKFKPISVPNKDAQWIEAQQFSVVEWARWFRMPPPKLQDLTNGTYANVAELAVAYVVDTLTSWMTRQDQEVSSKLLAPAARKPLFAELNASSLLRGDPVTRNQSHEIAVRNGWRNRNEVRRIENENPMGEEGDVYTVQAQIVSLESVLNPPEPEPVPAALPAPESTPDPAAEVNASALKLLVAELGRRETVRNGECDVRKLVESQVPLVADVFSRIIGIECDRATKADRQDRLAEWSGKFYGEHGIYVRGAIIPVFEAISSAVWSIRGCEPEGGAEALASLTEAVSARHVEESTAGLRDGGDFTVIVADWKNGRSMRSAQRECGELADLLEELSTQEADHGHTYTT